MRLMNNYVYANPFLDPVSLDALAVPDPDDSDILTHWAEDPVAGIEQRFGLMRVQSANSVFFRAFDVRYREIVIRV